MNRKNASSAIIYVLLLLISPSVLEAQFNWGNCGSTGGGSGSFNQAITLNAIVEVGEIISGLSGVNIRLTSANDIDIQLYDKNDNTAVVKWPNGLLSGSSRQDIKYGGLTI